MLSDSRTHSPNELNAFHISNKRLKNLDNRPSRRQQNSAPGQDRGKAVDNGLLRS